MPVMIPLEATPKLGDAFSLDSQRLTSFLTALTKALQSIADHTMAEMGALFDHESKYFLAIAIVRTNPGHHTKTTIKPYMAYLDEPKYFEIKSSKMAFTVRLVSKVNLWMEWNDTAGETIMKAEQLNKLTDKLTLIYFNSYIFYRGGVTEFGHFQSLSNLLYCSQVQLNDTEFIEKDGILTINTPKASFTVSDYYRVTPTQVRVCADQYLQKQRTSGSPPTCSSQHVFLLFFTTLVLDLHGNVRRNI